MRPLDQPWESFLTHPCNYPPFHILCNWSYCDFLQSLRIRSRANLVEINFKNPDQTPKCWKKGCLQSNENTPFSKTSKICNEYPSCNFSKNWWPKGTFRTTTPKINNLYIILSIENYFFYCSSAKWCSALLCSVHFNIKLQLNVGECAAERCRRTSTQSVSQYTVHSLCPRQRSESSPTDSSLPPPHCPTAGQAWFHAAHHKITDISVIWIKVKSNFAAVSTAQINFKITKIIF